MSIYRFPFGRAANFVKSFVSQSKLHHNFLISIWLTGTWENFEPEKGWWLKQNLAELTAKARFALTPLYHPQTSRVYSTSSKSRLSNPRQDAEAPTRFAVRK
jgi:hypothetical protein